MDHFRTAFITFERYINRLLHLSYHTRATLRMIKLIQRKPSIPKSFLLKTPAQCSVSRSMLPGHSYIVNCTLIKQDTWSNKQDSLETCLPSIARASAIATQRTWTSVLEIALPTSKCERREVGLRISSRRCGGLLSVRICLLTLILLVGCCPLLLDLQERRLGFSG